jgi:hypothetical protein
MHATSSPPAAGGLSGTFFLSSGIRGAVETSIYSVLHMQHDDCCSNTSSS